MRDQLINAMENAIQEVRQWPQKEVQIFHHNDSDGLSSGAILTRTFERTGFKVRRFCLEKPYPALLQKVYQQEGAIIVFADFAGRIAPMLSDFNQGRNLTLILDHHVAAAATDPRVHNLDPDLYGLKGDRDIAGATTCYLFAHTWDPANKDLAVIAAIGAVGDEFFVDGCLVSENREVALEAVRQGKMEIRPQTVGERYYLNTAKGQMPCDEFGAYLDTLGAAGFYRQGPDMGVKVCLEGATPESDRMLSELKAIQAKAFDDEISRLQSGTLRKTENIQWFHVENRFAPMGVKMIGVFCDAVKNADFVDPQRYVAGFQIIPDQIPGFGPIGMNDVKISMRVSARMEGEIRSGKKMGLDVLLPEATGRLGGFSDACHTLTAATTVAIGKEEALIQEMEKILNKVD
ncbi:MAG: DHH family phosphoesterase [Desulfobacterales bacterium]|nr:MAG: DHH family phosphoesterase [Desulfobacterales bacterium]